MDSEWDVVDLEKEFKILTQLSEYFSDSEINMINMNNSITLRQILYCLKDKNYSLSNAHMYDKESWQFKNIRFEYMTNGNSYAWFKNDVFHNDERDENKKLKPACMELNGNKFWCQNGESHNDDVDDNGYPSPATIFIGGYILYCINGYPHNDSRDKNGKLMPALVHENGSMIWCRHGDYHNDDIDENGELCYAIVNPHGINLRFLNSRIQ